MHRQGELREEGEKEPHRRERSESGRRRDREGKRRSPPRERRADINEKQARPSPRRGRNLRTLTSSHSLPPTRRASLRWLPEAEGRGEASEEQAENVFSH